GRLDALPGPGGSGGTSFDPSGATTSAPAVPADGLADLEVDGLATRERDRIAVAIWHHVDDQYARLPDADVTVELRGLPFDPARARVRHWRIDDTHSNAHAVWQHMGRPQDPTDEQLRTLKAHQGLEEGPAVDASASGKDILRVRLPLPLHAISLLEVEPG
ncbi:MAG TPA: hypothetical protein VFX49_15715, partial [Chloroflexota bacterium]|nr:hypothetical protein [Chloroflexota bacterium]